MRLALALLSCLAAVAVHAQQPPLFRAESDLVVVHAMVEDGRGAAVPGLQPGNFLVYEDNRPQEISFFSATDAPASIGLLIDNSTSMASKRDRVVAAAVEFAELSNPDDEVFVLAFNEDVREAWPPRVLAESELAALGTTLRHQIAARGQTALFDAIHGGLDRLRQSRHARQVLVVVSDGADNASRAARNETLARVAASNAMIYTVALRDPVAGDGNPRLLRRLSAGTGGESFEPRRVDEVADALAHIARDIRATYTLGYVPTNQARDGTRRSVRVVASRDGRPLKVRTRTGYIAPGEERQGGARER